MPFARIDLIQGKPATYRQTIGEVVYQAMIDHLKAPANDRFQIITEHPAENFICDPTYLNVSRTPDCIFIQMTLLAGRSMDMKRAFYKAVATGLHERLGLRMEDVVISLVESTKGDWSFGNGEAQYDPAPK